MKEIIFSDLDGTIDTHPELYSVVQGIITGETWNEYHDTMTYREWPDLVTFFNPMKDGERPSLMDVVNHKSNIINKIGVTTFYENQKEQVDMLQILCPSCKVILVKDGEYAL